MPKKRHFEFAIKQHFEIDFYNKITRSITKYCRESGINTVIVGDIKKIREEFNKGRLLNQKMHSLPFNKVIKKLEYKLAIEGISLIMQKESYSSQCSPLSEKVSKQYAEKNKRLREACLLMARWSGMPTVLERITFFDYIEIEQKR